MKKNFPENPLSQTEIAQRLEISAAATAVSLGKLEKGGFLEKQPSENDMRSHRIRLTAKDRKIVEQSEVIFSEMDKAAFANITEDERTALSSIFCRITDNLANFTKDREDPDA